MLSVVLSVGGLALVLLAVIVTFARRRSEERRRRERAEYIRQRLREDSPQIRQREVNIRLRSS